MSWVVPSVMAVDDRLPGVRPENVPPSVAEQSARKTLRDAVYELRRAFGPAGEAVIATRDQIGLREDAVRVDLWEFRRRRAAGELEAAVACSRGDLLAGMDADWVLRARDDHAAELADTLGALAARALDAGDVRAAIAWARRRLEVEPLAEDAHRQLIRLLALAGDRPAALAAASALTERLRRELGVPPSGETRALVEDIRRGRLSRPAGEPAALSLPAPLARTARPEGREPELARLAAAWTDAAGGALRLALVAGEPGIGKTTLAGELARRLHARGAAVLYGRCDEQALVPYQPWVEALERLLDDLPAAEASDWLAAHDGALARLLPARGAGGGGPRERYLAFETVRAMVERRPLLLVLDDVHWADQDSLALLRHVARTAVGARALILLCARVAEQSAALEDALADLRRNGPLLNVSLAGLEEDAIAAVLARRTGAADPAAARRYRRRSGGNPFFIDELLRDEHEGGEGPPPGVRDVVARRLARLAPRTQAALAAAAVIGLEFALEDLPGDPLERLEALDEAARAGLVTSVPGGHAFAHALVAETIVSTLPAAQRARLHLQAAERHGAPAAEVARHLRAAGPLVAGDRLAEWELAAAREAMSALAYAEAARHYESALAAAGPDPARLLALGHAHDRAGRRSRARAAFVEAAALARSKGDPGLVAQAALATAGSPSSSPRPTYRPRHCWRRRWPASRAASTPPLRACGRGSRSSSTTPTAAVPTS